MVEERPAGVMIQVTVTAQFHEKTLAMNEALILGSVRQHELTEAADASNAQIREADVRKNEFLAMLAHELRNPLAPIRYMLEIMKRADGNGDLIKPALGTIERQVRQLTRLIDDLLDVSRISRDKLQLRREEVEFASVIHHVVEASRSACESAQLELTVTLPPQPVYLHADPVRLAQVFGNLLHNACKFTKPGGRISLAAERQGADVVVTVRDSGIGIPSDMLPKIFEMFTQGDQTLERSQGGLGIGLTLVRRLVTMHGGSVQAFSDGVDRGSEFVVHLPALIKKPASLSPEPTIVEPTPITARRILVVDDNHDAADSLSILLKLSGNETHLAFDGEEAVEAAARFRPDVVLMDIGMPKLNGYGAARQIREQPWGKGMVLVALTGWGQDEDRQKTADAGFDGHLVKPVEYAALTKVLASFPMAGPVP
jgi:signal transduction histidine kinase